jgi:hypothetical protein
MWWILVVALLGGGFSMPAYAEHKKAELINNLGKLPDGIQDFLEVALPAAPIITTPADVDAAIIASGVLSKYLLDVFALYEGLYVSALPLHVGQLNDWHNAGVLAGLQQWEGAASGEDGSEELSDIDVINPQEGGSYQPGALRIQVRAIRGSIAFCDAQIAGGASYPPLDLEEEQGQFWGMVYLRYEGTFSLTVHASFADDRPDAEQIVNFSIDADATQTPESGAEDDLKGFDLLKKVFDDAMRRVLSGSGNLSEVIAAARNLRKAPFPGGQGGSSGGSGASATWGERVDETIDDLLAEGEQG